MIKELWILVRSLFLSNPCDFIYEDLKVVEMKHFPLKGCKAMSWCGMIIHRKGTSEIDEKTINHEKIHVMQACFYADNSWIYYYLLYIWEWLKHGLSSPVSANYYLSRFESEAYANEEDMDYCERYKPVWTNKYAVLDAKKLYKELGGTGKAWKKYVKTL